MSAFFLFDEETGEDAFAEEEELENDEFRPQHQKVPQLTFDDVQPSRAPDSPPSMSNHICRRRSRTSRATSPGRPNRTVDTNHRKGWLRRHRVARKDGRRLARTDQVSCSTAHRSDRSNEYKDPRESGPGASVDGNATDSPRDLWACASAF